MKEVIYQGRRYHSLREASIRLGLPISRAYHRQKMGLSIDEIFAKDKLITRIWKDHKGKTFPTLSAMAKAYGKREALVNQRLNMGWSIEEALTDKKAVCYQGEWFKSVRALARKLNVGETCLAYRIKRKIPEELWGYKGQSIYKPITVFGKLYAGIKDACLVLGLDPKQGNVKLCNGFSLEEQYRRKHK